MAPNGVKILVIDDDTAILHALKLFLQQEGYDVDAATRFKDYFKKLAVADFPDLIVLDILLSEENGCNIAKALKADDVTADIPIVMISAHPNGGEMAEKAGAEAFLAKPFEMDELLGTIDDLAPQAA